MSNSNKEYTFKVNNEDFHGFVSSNSFYGKRMQIGETPLIKVRECDMKKNIFDFIDDLFTSENRWSAKNTLSFFIEDIEILDCNHSKYHKISQREKSRFYLWAAQAYGNKTLITEIHKNMAYANVGGSFRVKPTYIYTKYKEKYNLLQAPVCARVKQIENPLMYRRGASKKAFAKNIRETIGKDVFACSTDSNDGGITGILTVIDNSKNMAFFKLKYEGTCTVETEFDLTEFAETTTKQINDILDKHKVLEGLS
jgi:hypothetical protein